MTALAYKAKVNENCQLGPCEYKGWGTGKVIVHTIIYNPDEGPATVGGSREGLLL